MSRVDIVVPCYNYARYLRECVESITSQSHRELRVLIIDDASSDDTATVAAALAAADSRIEVRRHERNIGHIATYNEGIAWLDGDYWLLISADDFLLPGALQRAVEALDLHPDVGLVYGAVVEFAAGGALPYLSRRRSIRGVLRTAELAPHVAGRTGELHLWDSTDLVAKLGVGNCIAAATAITRVDVQKQVGFYRDELKHAGDLEMWLRYALRGQVGYIDSCQAVYRRHSRNMSLDYHGYPDFPQRVLTFDLHDAEIRNLSPDGRAIARAIRRRHARKAAKLLVRSLREGRMDQFLELCLYPLRRLPSR